MAETNASRNKLAKLQSKHKNTLVELDRYKLLVETVQDYAIFLLDKDGYVQTWNKGAQKNKGYAADEIIGRHFSTFYMERDKKSKKPERELKLARQLGRIEDEDWRIRKDGSKFWANVIITALHNDDGELVGFAKVTRDLTERKQHESNLRDANTALKKQQEELQRLNASKDEFISLASHQLRTPATAIKQLLGLALEGYEGEIPDNLLQIIKKSYDSNERQIGIINSLLKVAQVDAGHVVLRPSDTDVQQLIQDVIDEQSENIAKRQQTVTVKTSDTPVTVHADAQYLRMALENIIDNASKYTFDSGTITIEVKNQGDTVKLSVQDTGVGVSSDDMAMLFEKFSRITNDLSQRVAGSGLGLYWVKKVIELHGGTINVESTPNKGTTFHVCLPAGYANA